MRALVQRVSRASVTVDGEVVGAIGPGLCVFVGVTHTDGPAEAAELARKLWHLRIFPDDEDRMDRPVADVGGEVLVVSQFTLYGDTSAGRRPSWIAAARPEHAEPLVQAVVDHLRGLGATVATGRFRTEMVVAIDNDTMNAMASPGGHVFVYTGLMDLADDDGLRGVLAHEVAHAVYRHGLQGLVRSQLLNLGLAWLLGDVGELEKLVVGQGASLLSLAYSRAQEDECDGYALQLADAQGWSLVGMVKLYRAFPESGAPELLATHPDSAERARRIEEHLARR